MLKDLFALVDNAHHANGFIRNAVAFAEAQNAPLAITVLTKESVDRFAWYAPLGAATQTVSTAVKQEVRLDTIRALTSSAAVAVEVAGVAEDPLFLAGAAHVEARATDLLVVGPDAAFEDARLRRNVIETALMSSGTPVLILPAGATLTRVRHAVVGWDGSAEARRAVRDLLTLIEAGGRIDIVSVDPKGGAVDADRSPPGSSIARLLGVHGYVVELRVEDSAGRRTSAVLESFAAGRADLLVIGAFAHSRVREIFLGSVTREVIENVSVPVLLSR